MPTVEWTEEAASATVKGGKEPSFFRLQKLLWQQLSNAPWGQSTR